MIYMMKSPFALYRAFSAAHVPDDIARAAAYAVSTDLKAMIEQLVTEHHLDIADVRAGSPEKALRQSARYTHDREV
jgi:hypothetical protein